MKAYDLNCYLVRLKRRLHATVIVEGFEDDVIRGCWCRQARLKFDFSWGGLVDRYPGVNDSAGRLTHLDVNCVTYGHLGVDFLD